MLMLMINEQDLQQDPEYHMRVLYKYEPFYQRSSINANGSLDHQTVWAVPADSDLATALALRWTDDIWFQEVA